MLDAKTIAQALGRASRSGAGWKCLCPAHDDRNPSLSVTDSEDGRVLVRCHAGCSQESVIAALTDRGLWPQRYPVGGPKQLKTPGSSKLDAWTPVLPVPADAPKPDFNCSTLGKPSLKWEYRNQKGETLGFVVRYEQPNNGKTFRPLTFCKHPNGKCEWRQQGFPKPYPLYGLERLSSREDSPIVVAEGEKAADCAQELLFHMVGVSWPHGAKSVNDVDWAPLAGREVLVWPDADDEGQQAAQQVCRQCVEAGVKSVRLIRPPKDAPKGWDAADALAEDYSPAGISELIEQAEEYRRPSPLSDKPRLELTAWRADRFAGQPPERRWLVDRILPLATPCMVAAIGGIGKSMLMLKLALEVATGDLGGSEQDDPERMFGSTVTCHGSAVLITAEDDAAEVHRRLCALDPSGMRLHHPERLVVVPLPNAGGILTLLRGGFQSPEVTEEYEDLRRQLMLIPDLKLIVLDPLQAFVGADANKDPAAGQYLCTLLGNLAATTGATVIVTHHFRKQRGIKGPSEAREAVRGTTALIDGMRCVYALWPAEEQYARKVCRELGIKFEANRVVKGAVVKANWPAELKVETYVRNALGLLSDHTDQLGQGEDRNVLLAQLEDAIKHAAAEGKPYTKTGKNGVYERRDELPPGIRRIGRNRLQDMVQELLNGHRATQCAAGKSGTVQWLDVPGGPFDRGEGSFAPGAVKSKQHI